MKVRLTDEAKTRLRAIHTYIAADSPVRAGGMIDRIIRRVETIAPFPFGGRKVPEFDREDLREVPESPYRIIYRIKPNEIQVVTIMHYRQLLPNDLA
jgi:plasmid stabilization system protein ParE